MYWNYIMPLKNNIISRINRNMRCIEIENMWYVVIVQRGLIETWDVLKFIINFNSDLKNIRLIETWDVLKFTAVTSSFSSAKINRNMRCIEIIKHLNQLVLFLWLIETWDVLKYLVRYLDSLHISWLIETWDVLKFTAVTSSFSSAKINRNMRCIEIILVLVLSRWGL